MRRNSILVSALILAPSIMTAVYLSGHFVPAQYAYTAACAILTLAVIDFITVICIEPYHRTIGKLTIPAILLAMSIIFLFIVVTALNTYFEKPAYQFITPFNMIAMGLLYAAIYCEKSVLLKSYLSINSIALVLLWKLGVADKITMPF